MFSRPVSTGEFKINYCAATNRNNQKTAVLTGAVDSLVVVRVDADVLVLCVERIRADFERFQLVVALQVGPPPHAAVDDVRKTLSV